MSPVNELPVRGSQFYVRGPAALNRRQALNLLAAGVASGLAACSKPVEEIIPYVTMPERVVPGAALKFATTLSLSGLGRGVIVTSIDGRPIKVEGNPRHPASLGATDVFAEAAVLSLYDPDRSRTILKDGAIASPDALQLALQDQLAQLRQRDGAGLRLLTGRVTSPTLLRQIDDLKRMFPKAQWHAYDPLDDGNAKAGAMLAYGRPLRAMPRLDATSVLVALDADPLGHGPDQMRNARGFAARRQPQSGAVSRIYAIEATPTLTGAKADHRLALPPQLIGEIAVAIGRAMGAPLRAPQLSDAAARITERATTDLMANRGGAMVLAGKTLPPDIHALVHWINAKLQAPVDLVDLGTTPSGARAGTFIDLADELDAGLVSHLITLGVNPGYDAPADLDYARRCSKAASGYTLGAMPTKPRRLPPGTCRRPTNWKHGRMCGPATAPPAWCSH